MAPFRGADHRRLGNLNQGYLVIGVDSDIIVDSVEKKLKLRDTITTFKSKVWTHNGFDNIDGTNKIHKTTLHAVPLW